MTDIAYLGLLLVLLILMPLLVTLCIRSGGQP